MIEILLLFIVPVHDGTDPWGLPPYIEINGENWSLWVTDRKTVAQWCGALSAGCTYFWPDNTIILLEDVAFSDLYPKDQYGLGVFGHEYRHAACKCNFHEGGLWEGKRLIG